MFDSFTIEIGISVRSHHVSQLFLVIIFMQFAHGRLFLRAQAFYVQNLPERRLFRTEI